MMQRVQSDTQQMTVTRKKRKKDAGTDGGRILLPQIKAAMSDTEVNFTVVMTV